MNPDIQIPTHAAMLAMQQAFNAGEIQFWPVNKYTVDGVTHFPKLGYMFYRICFIKDGVVLYNGCFEMKIKISDHLKQTPGMLETTLCWMLAPKVILEL